METRRYSEKIRVLLCTSRTYEDLPIASSDALPLGELSWVLSRDVTAAMLVFQNKEMAAMMVYQTNPSGIELCFYANTLFCFSNPIWLLVTWVKTLHRRLKGASYSSGEKTNYFTLSDCLESLSKCMVNQKLLGAKKFLDLRDCAIIIVKNDGLHLDKYYVMHPTPPYHKDKLSSYPLPDPPLFMSHPSLPMSTLKIK